MSFNLFYQSNKKHLTTMARQSYTSLRDTWANHSHSRDFIYARGDYLRNRVSIVAILFLVLLPFWTLLDHFMLPESSQAYTLAGRIGMGLALIAAIALAHFSKIHLARARLAAGILLATPALFYVLILTNLPTGTSPLIGYSFIPYMLVAMLAIFPFTLLESLIFGFALIALQAYASYVANNLFSLAGIQDIWLLAALLSIAITANYFQLSLMLRLYRAATHDPLTSLLNRGALIQTVNQLPKSSHTEHAILLMDLDNFKRINDNHGHMFGDEILKNFSQILRETLASDDIAARYGGEEFIAILTHTHQEKALEIAETIRKATESAMFLNFEKEPVNITVSIGVAALRPPHHFEEAIKLADERLYEAKRRSRNCVVGA